MSPSPSVSPDAITGTLTERIVIADPTVLPRRRRETVRRDPTATDPPRRTRRARRNSHQTRALLLEAARRRFDRLGYDKASVRDIAADAGVSQGLIFRYFGTKEELYRACTAYEERLTPDSVFSGPHEELGDHLMGLFRRVWPAPGGGCHPLVGLLRQPSGDVDGHAHLRKRLIDDLPRQFSGHVSGQDAEERGLLLLSWLMGMGIMRSVLGAPALQGKSLDRLAPHFNRVVAALVADPAGEREQGAEAAPRHPDPVRERRSA